MSKKPELSAGLVAIKGSAAPAPDMPGRTFAPPVAAAEPVKPEKGRGEELVPLNFRIPVSFRRAFKTYAAEHDLKLNELLQRCFEAYCQQRAD
jgi:hypothetical protein